MRETSGPQTHLITCRSISARSELDEQVELLFNLTIFNLTIFDLTIFDLTIFDLAEDNDLLS